MGRHSRALSKLGYSVTGIDRSANAIATARQLGGGPKYFVADVREYRPQHSAFDVAIIMGQSFGHFDETTNRDLLRRLATALRIGGRMILDLWNPEFFIAHQGKREFHTAHGPVEEHKHVNDGRLLVHLTYPDGADEFFDWQLFTESQMIELTRPLNLEQILICSDFNISTAPSIDRPRMQFVLAHCDCK